MDELIKAAEVARETAYVPYSHFKVGAAVLGRNGKIYSGGNMEELLPYAFDKTDFAGDGLR